MDDTNKESTPFVPNYSSPFIEWNQNNQPTSTQFNDIYFSEIDGLEESRYVFLNGNMLSERFSNLKKNQHFCIGETGFGTGLNFLSCWQLWKQQSLASNRLTYISIEKFPLKADEIDRALSCWPELAELKIHFVNSYRKTISPNHAIKNKAYYVLDFDRVRLILIIDDAISGFNSLLNCNHAEFSEKQWDGVNAWFLDGFTPSRNPEMWTEKLFRTLHLLSSPKASFSTFTAASNVRKNLNDAGFATQKQKGFGTKREMLVGSIQQDAILTAQSKAKPNFNDKKNQKTPWSINRFHTTSNTKQDIAIIGAGLAGCHTAYSLAKRGFKVTLFDSAQTMASAASGNPQGIVYGKLSADNQFLSEFNHAALRYAQQHYSYFWQKQPEQGKDCGVLQISSSLRDLEQHQLIAQQFQDSEFLTYIDPNQASELAGIPLRYPALLFPNCGWLNPFLLCQWLIKNPLIQTSFNTTISSVTRQDNTWLVKGRNKTSAIDHVFDKVVFANANAAKEFDLSKWLPTKAIRGQITYIPSQNKLAKLKVVICGKGYIAPNTRINGLDQHAIGASYNLHDSSTTLADSDHQSNLQQLQALLSDENQRDVSTIEASGGRVGFRCTSPDYLPLVGPLPNYDAFINDYKELRNNAKQVIPISGNYHHGLFLNIGHGSRGLAYTPLASELLACTIANEVLPVSHGMAEKLNPARFIIRELSRSN